MDEKYRIAMFAHNEEDSIANAIESIFESFDESSDVRLFVLANGCTDRTVEIVRLLTDKYPQIKLIEILFADKCNAWNEYVYKYADDSFCHFFCDADVKFSLNAFQIMKKKLSENSDSHAVAGVPLTGRGKKKYLDMIKCDSVIFGNLYAVKKTFLEMVREKEFRIPSGYFVNDNLIGRIICTDIDRKNEPPNKYRVVYDLKAGYIVRSLNPFSLKDIRIYLNRLIRYRLGGMQQDKLRPLQYDEFPESMDDINLKIRDELKKSKIPVCDFVTRGVLKRLL